MAISPVLAGVVILAFIVNNYRNYKKTKISITLLRQDLERFRQIVSKNPKATLKLLDKTVTASRLYHEADFQLEKAEKKLNMFMFQAAHDEVLEAYKILGGLESTTCSYPGIVLPVIWTEGGGLLVVNKNNLTVAKNC